MYSLEDEGFSLTWSVVRFHLEKQKSFNEGQIYVALSRVTRIDYPFLIEKYNLIVLKVNDNVIIEYSRLQENMFGRSKADYVPCNNLKASLLNHGP